MFVNELIVLPTEDTLAQLKMMFAQAPFEIHPATFHVVVNTSEYEMTAHPEDVYAALPTNGARNFDIWYDSATGLSALILSLTSPSLSQRFESVQSRAPNAFFPMYYPHMVVNADMPPTVRRHKGWLNSLADSFASMATNLFFEGEFVVQKEYRSVPFADYYIAQSNSVFG